MIGKTISHYNILEKLGEGGMGVVYKAEDTKLRRTVALKFLSPQALGTEDERARFIHEAQAAAALNHPNICTIYEIDEADGQSFIAMEYVEGKSIEDRIGSGPLKLEESQKIAIQIAKGLREAHRKGIVHRDIKPSNIMITDEGRVKIMDFGLAKSPGRKQLTREGTTLGTVAYMSPEQGRGEAVDSRTDIWSLGVIAYEMVTGKRPFKGDYEQAVIYSIMNENPEPITGMRSGVPLELERVISRCLEKESGARYQTAGDLTSDLRRIQGRLVSSGRQAEAVPHRVRARRRWPWLIGAVSVVVVLAAVFFPRLVGRRDTSPNSSRQKLAVLPFENLGAPEDDYFANGITDAITARLAGIRGLGVISRQSTIQYKGSKKSIQDIGDELGAAYILEGTVQREKPGDPNSRIRIIPQLISVSDDIHLWADTYDEDMTEVFRVQSDIAERVAHALNITLLETEREALVATPTENLEAYEYYLRGNEYFMMRYDDEVATSAVQMFERATEIDPGFTLAWAGLSRAYIWTYYSESVSNPDWKAAARIVLERARELDPDSPDVQIALGYFYYYGAHDFDRALGHLESARSSRPNDVEILSVIAFIKRRQGKWDESAALLEKAADLNPRYFVSIMELGVTYATMRHYDKAVRLFDRSLFFGPRDPTARVFKIMLPLLRDGDAAGAREALWEASKVVKPANLGFMLHGWCLMRILAESYAEILSRVPSEEYGVTDTTLFHLGLAEMYHQQDLEEQARDCWRIEQAHLETAESPLFQPDIQLCLGLAYAGLGRKEEAIQLAREFLADEPLSQDAFLGTFRLQKAALIFVRTGAHEEAIDQLELLLSVPSGTSRALFRLDPAWDPLRDNPRFQKLMEEEPQ